LDEATGLTTLYDGAGNIIPLVVTIPKMGVPSGPTGQLFNGTSDFNLPNGMPAPFLFDTLDSQILGWNRGVTVVNVATTPGAIYTGMVIGNAGVANYLYRGRQYRCRLSVRYELKDVTLTTLCWKIHGSQRVSGIQSIQHSKHQRQPLRDLRQG